MYLWGTNYNALIGDSEAEDFGGSGNIDIAQVQLCAGDVALPFMPKSFEEELRACQRYYEKSYGYNVVPATATTLVGIETKVVPNNTVDISQQYGKVNFKITKRSTPTTVTIYPYTTPANTDCASTKYSTFCFFTLPLLSSTVNCTFT